MFQLCTCPLSGLKQEHWLLIGFGVFLLVVVPITATFISSRCSRQPAKLPVVPEILPDDGSTTDEDWKFILQNSTKTQPVRCQSAPEGRHNDFTILQARR